MNLYSQRMVKVTLTGPRSVTKKVIDEMHQLKAIHIVDHTPTESIDIGSPLDAAESLSELLVLARAIKSCLIPVKRSDKKEYSGDLRSESEQLRKLHSEVVGLLEKKSITKAQHTELGAQIPVLEVFAALGVNFEHYFRLDSVGAIVGTGTPKAVIKLRNEQMEVITAELGNKAAFAIFFPKKLAEKGRSLVEESKLTAIDISKFGDLTGSPDSHLRNTKKKMSDLDAEMSRLDSRTEQLSKSWIDWITEFESDLSSRLEKAESPLKFAQTDHIFVVSGWIPKDSYHSFVENINEACNGKISIETEPIDSKDKVPVKLKNPGIVKPFEFFMNLYALPKYREIDPTFFTFLTFPIFFGIILGDFGYGLVTLAIFFLLRKLIPGARQLIDIMILSSFSTIFFGILFGEFFGLEEVFGIPIWHLISRAHSINEMLYISIAIGAVHINFGLLIGFVNEAKLHGLSKAIFAKASWWVLQAAAVLIALPYLGIVLIPTYIGAATFLVAVIMLFKGEGIRGFIEMPALLSNMLSYSRLMAVGLASVSLAIIINEMAGELFHSGAFGIAAGTTILVLGHVINIMLGLIGGFLQSLRLHYVEFFGKFFEGGAIPFRAFGETGGR